MHARAPVAPVGEQLGRRCSGRRGLPINIGMATGMLPVVGITLPLVSYGGSSLIAMMAAMGVLISINTRRYLF